MFDLNQWLATHYVYGTDVNNDLCHLRKFHMLKTLPCGIYGLTRDAQTRLKNPLIYEYVEMSVNITSIAVVFYLHFLKRHFNSMRAIYKKKSSPIRGKSNRYAS